MMNVEILLCPLVAFMAVKLSQMVDVNIIVLLLY